MVFVVTITEGFDRDDVDMIDGTTTLDSYKAYESLYRANCRAREIMKTRCGRDGEESEDSEDSEDGLWLADGHEENVNSKTKPYSAEVWEPNSDCYWLRVEVKRMKLIKDTAISATSSKHPPEKPVGQPPQQYPSLQLATSESAIHADHTGQASQEAGPSNHGN